MTTYRLACKRFVWLNVVRPTRADVEALSKSFPYIHPVHLEDLISPTERPKMDEEDAYLFVVMQFPAWDPQMRLSRAAEVDFVVGKDVLITAHDGVLKPLLHLFAQCELYQAERDRIVGRGANDAFYTILDQLVDYIFPILNKVDGNIRRIEERIFEDGGRALVEEISLVRRDVIALRRIIRQQAQVVEGLAQTEHPVIREELEAYFDDTVDHLIAARDIIEEDYEVTVALAETADALISHRTNEVVRALTVISVIMLPLTLVTGFFGMNVDFPLDEGHPQTLIFVVGIMVAVAAAMLLFFRNRKWL